MFEGLITALITPFKNNQLDLPALEKIIEFQIENQVDGLIIAGTTGEGFLLNQDEFKFLISHVIKFASNRIKVFAGCSGIATQNVIDLATFAQYAGVNGLMATIPSYLKPTQEGIYAHFNALNNASSVPIMLYSNPSRTQVDFNFQTILDLSQLNNIVAWKDSSANLERMLNLKMQINDLKFKFLCGDDALALAFYAHGANGWAGVISNAFPKLCREIHDAWRNQDFKLALSKQLQLVPLYNVLYSQPNPIGIKFAMHALGFCSREIRLPLTMASLILQEQIKQAIENLK